MIHGRKTEEPLGRNQHEKAGEDPDNGKKVMTTAKPGRRRRLGRGSKSRIQQEGRDCEFYCDVQTQDGARDTRSSANAKERPFTEQKGFREASNTNCTGNKATHFTAKTVRSNR